MNVTRVAVLGVALVAGVGAFFLMMGNQPAEQAPIQVVKPVEEKTVRVLVADKDFARGERLGVDTTRWVQWPEKALSEAFITEDSGANQEELAEAVARTLIIAGEPIIEAKIVRAGNSSLMAAVVSPGMRAVTMRVTPEKSAGGFILPGDKVDIHFALEGDEERAQVSTLLQDIRVLAVDSVFSENPETPNIIASNITLEMTPPDAKRFISAKNSRGQLSLALRSVFQKDGDDPAESQSADVEVIRYGRS